MNKKLLLISIFLMCSVSSSAEEQTQKESDESAVKTETYLDSILVSGQRVERPQQKTASSVVVTTSTDLDDYAGADTLNRVFEQTPNLTFSGEGNQGPTIRGTNTSGVLTSLESFFGGSQPRTTIQVDGRQLSFNEFVYTGNSVWDIDQVEIYRGPQTTTQGRNAIAGAIYIRTANPNHQSFENRFRAILGNYDTRQISGVISGPIGDGQVAYRLSADFRNLDSYIKPQGVTDNFGGDVRESETINLRGKFSFKPEFNNKLTALLTLNHTDSRRPQTDSVNAPFETLNRFNPGFSVFDIESNGVVFDLDYQLSEQITFSSTTTYSDADVKRFAPLGQGNADINSDEITTEFITTFNQPEGQFSALLGVYLSQFDSNETLNLNAFELGIGDFSDVRKSSGIFGEATWGISNDLYLTAGARWQKDSQNRDGGFEPVIPIDFDDDFDEFLPKVQLAYDIEDNVRVGVLAERGYNAGGFTFNFDTFESETFKKETLWNYEVFLRNSLLGGRLMLNSNVFYSRYSDIQIATLVELGPDFFANVFSNAPHAESYGLEIDTRYKINNSWKLKGGLGISKTEFTSDSDAGALINGNEFQRTAGLTAVGGAVWEPTSNFSISAFGRYSDGYYSDDANRAINAVGSYFTTDIQASYWLGNTRLFLDVTNVFDRFYEVVIFDSGTLASVGAPRRLNIGIDISF